MKRVAVTGAGGNIGRPVMAGLAERYDLVPMSRSINGADLRDPEGLVERFVGCEALIHLAWQYTSERTPRGQEFLDNVLMHRNVLHAAKAAGVRRAVMASSVHADYFYDWTGPGLRNVDRTPRANDLYGGTKLLIEELGRDLADEHLAVINVRYGSVTRDGSPHPTDAWERRVWLSHGDLCAMLDAVLDHPDPPVHCTFYAVSDNEGRVHDTSNPFGWSPRDRTEALASEPITLKGLSQNPLPRTPSRGRGFGGGGFGIGSKRLDTRCLIRPQDLPPSRDGFGVIGAFNPAAVQLDDGSVVMLVRVAERPVERRDGFIASPRYTRDETIEIDWIDERDVTTQDPRMVVFKDTGFKRLTFTSHLRVVRLEADGVTVREVGGIVESFEEHATFGLEDPRITKVEPVGEYYITAVAASEHGVCTVLMSTDDFESYLNVGVIFCRENKDVVLFPEKIHGLYAAIHRPTGKFEVTQPELWLAFSPDIRHWGSHAPLWGSAPGTAASRNWDNDRVGGGVPPIRTDRGWLVIYHASCKPMPGEPTGVYAAGALLLDLENPSEVLAASTDAFMRPEHDFEKQGFVNAVVFPTGYVMQGDDILLYYGAADTNVGVVRYRLDDLLDSLQPLA